MPARRPARDDRLERAQQRRVGNPAQSLQPARAKLRARVTRLGRELPRTDGEIKAAQLGEMPGTRGVEGEAEIRQLVLALRWDDLIEQKISQTRFIADDTEPHAFLKAERVRVCARGEKRVARLQQERQPIEIADFGFRISDFHVSDDARRRADERRACTR